MTSPTINISTVDITSTGVFHESADERVDQQLEQLFGQCLEIVRRNGLDIKKALYQFDAHETRVLSFVVEGQACAAVILERLLSIYQGCRELLCVVAVRQNAEAIHSVPEEYLTEKLRDVKRGVLPNTALSV